MEKYASLTRGQVRVAKGDINESKVKAAAWKMAQSIFGDKADKSKSDGMAARAIEIADSTQSAIGIVKGFFKKRK